MRVSYTRTSRKEKKGVRSVNGGGRGKNAGRSLAKGLSFPTSRFFIPSFLPSFLPSFRGAIWDHAVYISSGYYMHILLSCIRFSTLYRGSLVLLPPPNLPQYPVPMPYYTARMQVELPRTPPQSPSLAVTFSVLLLLFLPVWNPNSWRLVAEGTVPRLSHREIHSQAQLMPSESKSYFVHSHSNGSFTISLLLSVFLYLFNFFFCSFLSDLFPLRLSPRY